MIGRRFRFSFVYFQSGRQLEEFSKIDEIVLQRIVDGRTRVRVEPREALRHDVQISARKRELALVRRDLVSWSRWRDETLRVCSRDRARYLFDVGDL